MSKPICIRQRDSADCGPACLASVAAYYGLREPVSKIRMGSGTGKQGTSLQGMTEAARQLGFQVRAVRAEETPLTAIPAPAIFHLVLENGFQHFVVLYKVRKKAVRIMDPATGRLVKKAIGVFRQNWTGIVLLLVPAETFKRGDHREPVFKRFWQLMQPHRGVLVQALAGAFVYTALGLGMSVYVQKIIDFVLPDGNKRLMNLLSLAMIIVVSFKMAAGYFKSLIALRTGQLIDARLILGYFEHLLALPQRFFDNMRAGEIISRVNDAVSIRAFINETALALAVHLLTVALSLLIMFVYSWKLAIIVALTIPLYGGVYWVSNRINATWQRKIMERGALLESQMVESIQNISTIRRMNAQSFFSFKTEKYFVRLMRAIYKTNHTGLRLNNLMEWMASLLTIVILWMGARLAVDHLLSPGQLLSFYTLTAYFTTPVLALVSSNKSMQDALIAADRLFEIIGLETETANRQPVLSFHPGDLILSEIDFHYGAGARVFSKLNLRFFRNRITAIVGESGCGKSTIFALIQRIYPLGGGRIFIGETDIEYLSLTDLRDRIGVVSQQSDLFEGTILSNVALGEPQPDFGKICDLCKKLGLHEFIDRLPLRYETVIRENGNNLSGGQKQRLAIARAMYRDPDILLLDEATSALDPESERRVQETLTWFHEQKKTIVLIAHRLSTIKYCDSVIFLKPGGESFSGRHEILLSDHKEYAYWWKNNYV